MSNFKSKCVLGNTVLYPEIIRRYLVKSHYFLCYDPKNEILTLNVNHGSGGQVLLEIRQVSYENAAKLAEGFGLQGDGETPLVWSKWNPIFHLHHDGSKNAETLHVEILKLGIPLIMHYDSKTLCLSDGRGLYESSMWSLSQMLQVVRDTARMYKKQLATTP